MITAIMLTLCFMGVGLTSYLLGKARGRKETERELNFMAEQLHEAEQSHEADKNIIIFTHGEQ